MGDVSIRRSTQRKAIGRSHLFCLMFGVGVGFLLSSIATIAFIYNEQKHDMANTEFLLHHYEQRGAMFDSNSELRGKSRFLEETMNGLMILKHEVRFRGNTEPRPTKINIDDGWKTIHVYIGRNASLSDHIVDTSLVPGGFYQKTIWFAQYRQDLLVHRLLRNKTEGYFVDLAANDAVRISNTYSLERFFGWKGLAIEPNSVYWSSLSYRQCDVVAAVVGQEKDEEIRFKFPREKAPQGGIIGTEFKNKNESHASKENQRRRTVTLLEIFMRFNTPSVIDYLSMDVEGAETFILKNFPFDRYRFNVLTVENPDTELSSILELNGYRNVKRLRKVSNETMWVHVDLLGSKNVDKTALEIDSESYSYMEQTRT